MAVKNFENFSTSNILTNANSASSWFNNLSNSISRSASLAGSNMAMQATVGSPFSNVLLPNDGANVSEDSQSDLPQGDSRSLDMTGYDQAEWQYQKQLELDELERQFNSAEAQKNRDFQREMSNTAYQRAVRDLKAAGLNPWLALQGSGMSGASTPSGSSASSGSGSASVPNPSIYKAILSLVGTLASSASSIFRIITKIAL